MTVESFDEKEMTFALAAETLTIVRQAERNWVREGCRLNVERSLRFGDRVHGHFVTGHVDDIARVSAVDWDGGSLLIRVRPPESVLQFLWKKGSFALNGVSLTINEVEDGEASVCLIPETVQRTNLGRLQVGDWVHIEVDPTARALIGILENGVDNLRSRVNGRI